MIATVRAGGMSAAGMATAGMPATSMTTLLIMRSVWPPTAGFKSALALHIYISTREAARRPQNDKTLWSNMITMKLQDSIASFLPRHHFFSTQNTANLQPERNESAT